MDIGERPGQFFVRHLPPEPERKVVTQGLVQQPDVLADDRHAGMQRRERVLPDIGTVQKDGARCAVVETREEIDKRRFTRSTRADDRGDFAGGDGCTQVVEHLARLCVAEIEVGDLDFVRDPSEGLLTGGHDKLALVGEEPRHGLQTRKFLGNAKAELADHFVVTQGLLKWEEKSSKNRQFGRLKIPAHENEHALHKKHRDEDHDFLDGITNGDRLIAPHRHTFSLLEDCLVHLGSGPFL